MRTTRWFFLTLCTLAVACGNNNGNGPKTQCNDGVDNDGDGAVDFPDDLGCTSAMDDSEDSAPSPQCSDGRDNDGDGKIDFPYDPGCFAPQQDDESDDCPDGPSCPQCSNGKDDDMNGSTDFPNDPGCTAASDNDEYTDNPVACGNNVHVMKLPFNGHATGMLMAGGASGLTSPTCGGGGPEDVYELRINTPKVVVASTDNAGTTADTVLYIRSADCVNNSSEMACNDDAAMAMTMGASTVTASIATPGTYYLVVDAHDSGTTGTYDLTVKLLTGEGESCVGPSDCGPGLVCRIPLGGTEKVCAKHVCSDGVDDDGDGKLDYPTDPGCTAADDDDESDPCPGAGCPECADGIDNDGDTKTDYPNDTTCTSASSASESCVSTDGVVLITQPMTMGDTTTAHNDVNPTCGSSSGTANDLTYRIDVPALASLTITLTATWDGIAALYNSTCGGTALQCSDTPPTITLSNVAAGTYYYVVDGYFNDTFDTGPFTFTTVGKIANGVSCESPLVTSGVLTCNTGYACKGTVGSRTCQPALCSDGIDNDGDGKIDYPFDPGCTDPADDTESPNPTTVCNDGMDNDGDSTTDFPADFGCASASSTSEVFCTGEMDAAARVTTKTTTGTTASKSNDSVPSCRNTSTAPDVAYALMLPVPVSTLVVDTIGSGFDTVLTVRNTQCTMELGCDDDSGGSGNSSLITLNNVAPGGYAIVVDGYGSASGAVTLNVHGTVAVGTPCDATLIPGGDATLFSGGANAVLSCPASCSAATHRCL